MELIQPIIDEITWLADINGKTKMVFEFENDFAIHLHIKEIKLQERNRALEELAHILLAVIKRHGSNTSCDL